MGLRPHRSTEHHAHPSVDRTVRVDGVDRVDRTVRLDGVAGLDGVDGLTERERVILSCLDDDRTLQAIASELFVTRNTVKSQVASVYRKLGVSSRAAAVARARELEAVGRADRALRTAGTSAGRRPGAGGPPSGDDAVTHHSEELPHDVHRHTR